MGSHLLGNKGRAKPKRKSIKTKALDINSKRRLAKLGKKKKAGHEGQVIRYITRARACKKLQVSLKDFRRLCILKGIYPRQPKTKKLNGKTCYHVKDIAFLSHEPLLAKFWEMKAYMKKVRRFFFRKEQTEAKRLYNAKPDYTLHHLVRERYPRFQDSLADMDDALCLIHLFANMHRVRFVMSDRSENCLRLSREWQLYVVMSRSLRKSFVSVKGIYYQADVMGTEITWIVPHKFAQNQPKEVDFAVMATFLEFYETLVGFVLYKLYHTLGMKYPPRLDQALDRTGAHLACIQPERLDDTAGKTESSAKIEIPEEEEAAAPRTAEKDESSAQPGAPETNQQRQTRNRIKSLNSKMLDIVKQDEAAQNELGIENDNSDEDNAEDRVEEREVFAENEEANMIEENEKLIQAQTNLFKGLVFWLSRETPLEPLEFVIRSFGGRVLTEDTGGNVNDGRITHFITDRPKVQKSTAKCEYVQPQWVFDSVNFRVLIPVARYAPNADLPPHLSPFVNNDAEGYKPQYAEELENLQTAAGLQKNKVPEPRLLRDTARSAADEDVEAAHDDEANEEDDEEDEQNEFDKDLKKELEGARARSGRGEKKIQVAESSEDEDEAKGGEEDDDDDEEEEDEEDDDTAAEMSRTDRGASTATGSADNSEEEEEEEEEVQPVKKKTKLSKQEKEDDKLSKKAKSAKAEAAEPDTKKKADKSENAELSFVPARRFVGAKKGYKFQAGPKGVGYYRDTGLKRKVTFKRSQVVSNRQRRMSEKKEELERSKMLMSGKARRLYGKMQHGIQRKKDDAKMLMERRRSGGSSDDGNRGAKRRR